MLCNASYYLMYRMTNKWKGITRFILLGILLYGLSELKLLTFANAIYFLAGVAIRQSGSNIIRISNQPLGLVPTDYTLLLPRKSESRNTGRSNYYISGNQLAAGNLHLSNGTNKKDSSLYWQ